MKQNETVLVTGGAGFIGSHLVDYLIDQMKMNVVVLDDLSGGYKRNVHPAARFVHGSIVDTSCVEDIFSTYHISYVYHLAAYAAEGLSHFIKRFNYTNNVIGTMNLINASVCHGVKCFVFTSSIAVYGTNQLPMREDIVPHPEDSYGIAKRAVEQELAISKEMFGLDFIIFRPHNVYGERQNIADRYRNVIGIFMNNIMQGDPLVIFGDGKQRRAFTYVFDIIPGIAESIHKASMYNQIFNVGSDIHISLNELADMVKNVFHSHAPVHHVSERKEVKIAYCDHAKFWSRVGIEKQTPLSVGLENMARWAKEIGPQKQTVFTNIEITKALPSVWNVDHGKEK